MNAAGSERTCFHCEQANLERRVLRERRRRKRGGACGGRGTGKELPAIGPVSHGSLPGLKAILARPVFDASAANSIIRLRQSEPPAGPPGPRVRAGRFLP